MKINIKRCFGVKYATFFFKGRIALYAILKAMEIKLDDEIILPGFSCVVVPNAVNYLGAKPVYVDINQKTYNIDASKIEEKITKKTKAIIAQHTFGIPAEMDKILEIAKKYNLFVIEDSCHAIGSKYKGKEVGTFGDAAFFSSQWSKPVTTGLGGWAVVNNPEIKENLEKIYPEFAEPSFVETSMLKLQYLLYSNLLTPSLFWFAQNTYRMLSRLGIAVGSSSNEELECKMPVDYKKKMSIWQKKILEKKLADISRIIDHRKWVVSQYDKLLPQIGVESLQLPQEYDPVYLRYPVLAKNKNKALESAKSNKIEIGDWFVSPLHPNLDGWEKAGYQKRMCPVAEDVCQHIINLPTHEKIGEKEIKKIVTWLGEQND
jgi:dTDP-4-amino-4,6-dideoxygalactose transaminase